MGGDRDVYYIRSRVGTPAGGRVHVCIFFPHYLIIEVISKK